MFPLPVLKGEVNDQRRVLVEYNEGEPGSRDLGLVFTPYGSPSSLNSPFPFTFYSAINSFARSPSSIVSEVREP